MLSRALRCTKLGPTRSLSRSYSLVDTTASRAIYTSVRPSQKGFKYRPTPRQQWSQTRQLSVIAGARRQFNSNPFTFTAALLFILCGSAGLLYTAFIYQSYVVHDFIRFPEPVAAKLRRALYYTNISLDPPQALKHYNQALELAEEHGMDPLGDEVIGVRVQVSLLLEKVGRCDLAAQVLEAARNNCLEWVRDKGGADGAAGRRNRVLQKAVSLSVKLGELYADPHVGDRESAEERLVWAVETVLWEKKRRENEGVKEGEGDWMTDEEVGGSIEALAHHYIAKDSFYLATPLLLRALSLSPNPSCHSAMLMSNIATTFAQQPPPSSPYPTPLPSSPETTSSSIAAPIPSTSSFLSFVSPFSAAFSPAPPKPTRFQPALSEARIQQIKQSRQWAEKALAHAKGISSGAGRTEECDQACVAAMHSLGEFAEMLGDAAEARDRYTEAKALARKSGYEEGKTMANNSLHRLKKNEM